MRDMPEQDVYALWAPPMSPWSAWVKPVLFAHMDETGAGSRVAPPQSQLNALEALARDCGDAALVVNLPGLDAVAVGLAMIAHGFRPIPLYNAAPGRNAVHELRPMIRALEGGIEPLMDHRLPHDAPPAFLLDSHRCGPREPGPGTFDNRWVVFPQDFPSGGFLMRHHVRRIVLVEVSRAKWQDDLCHVLRRWQEAGVQIERFALGDDKKPRPVDVPRPSFFRSMYYRFMVMMRFRRNSAGGFGGVVPQPSEGGGYSGGFG